MNSKTDREREAPAAEHEVVTALDQMTFDQATEILRVHLRPLVEQGAECPCCTQYVKKYKRNITGAMAYGLILMDRYDFRYPGAWVHVEDHLKSLPNIPSSIRGDMSKLCYWGLLERFDGERPDGSKRVGLYRITPAGKLFCEGAG